MPTWKQNAKHVSAAQYLQNYPRRTTIFPAPLRYQQVAMADRAEGSRRRMADSETSKIKPKSTRSQQIQVVHGNTEKRAGEACLHVMAAESCFGCSCTCRTKQRKILECFSLWIDWCQNYCKTFNVSVVSLAHTINLWDIWKREISGVPRDTRHADNEWTCSLIVLLQKTHQEYKPVMVLELWFFWGIWWWLLSMRNFVIDSRNVKYHSHSQG